MLERRNLLNWSEIVFKKNPGLNNSEKKEGVAYLFSPLYTNRNNINYRMILS